MYVELVVEEGRRGSKKGALRDHSERRHTRTSVLGRTPPHTVLGGRLSQATARELPRKHATAVKAAECANGVFRQWHLPLLPAVRYCSLPLESHGRAGKLGQWQDGGLPVQAS